MNTSTPTSKNHRFPPEIISHGIWLYFRFCLSYRDVEELLFARGITVTYEASRKWCQKFGQAYANQLGHRRPQPGDKWHLEACQTQPIKMFWCPLRLFERTLSHLRGGFKWTGCSRHYVCNGYQNHRDTALPQRCVLRFINADALEAAVWAEVEKVLSDPAFLRQALTLKAEETLERLPQLEAQAAQLQNQIAEAEKKERRALELALSLHGMPMETLREMVAEIQQDTRGWQEERNRLTWQMAELTATADRLRDVDAQINAIMASVQAHAYEQDRWAILELLIERI
jgi:hypothetical protein